MMTANSVPTTPVSFEGPFVPGTFSPATPLGSSKLRSNRCSQACIPCRTRKTKCNGSRPICGHCHTYNLPCSYQHEQKSAEDGEAQPIQRECTIEHVIRLEQRVSELEAQMAFLQDTQAYCTSPSILHSAPRPDVDYFH